MRMLTFCMWYISIILCVGEKAASLNPKMINNQILVRQNSSFLLRIDCVALKSSVWPEK